MSSAHNVIDPDLALERAGGNQELARELYLMLQNDLPHYTSKIQQHFSERDYTALLEVVHKLNGSTTYCGVPALKEAVSNLETHLKEGDEGGYAAGQERLLTEIARLQQAPELKL
jgi:two-component system sensor histidine kinase BarA